MPNRSPKIDVVATSRGAGFLADCPGCVHFSMAFTPCPQPWSDHLVKTEHGVRLEVRVWPVRDKNAPWLFWMHGGGFSAGYHHRMAPWIHELFYKRGYHIVPPAYRLAPHASFDDILKDVGDAYDWCRIHLPGILGADCIAVDRVVTGGDSAGGVLASMSGFTFRPPPAAILNLYGPVLVSHRHFYVPLPNADQLLSQLPFHQPRTEEQLIAAWSERDITKASTIMPWSETLALDVDDLQSYLGLPSYTPGEPEYLRQDLYMWMSVKRNRFPLVYRRENYGSEEEWQEALKERSPLALLNKVERYPPTFMLHGTGDTAAPFELSDQFVAKLQGKGCDVDYRWAPGQEHCFDMAILESSLEWEEYLEPLYRFIDHHVRGKTA